MNTPFLLDIPNPCLRASVARAAQFLGISVQIGPLSLISEPKSSVDALDQRTGNIILESTAPLRLGAVMDWVAARAVAKHENNVPDIIPMSSGSMDVRGRAFIPEKGAPIRLTDREVDTIRALFLAKDRTMDKAELLDQVWGYAVGAETHTIETHIYRLRQKIERNPSVPENIMTTENGYKLS